MPTDTVPVASDRRDTCCTRAVPACMRRQDRVASVLQHSSELLPVPGARTFMEDSSIVALWVPVLRYMGHVRTIASRIANTHAAQQY